MKPPGDDSAPLLIFDWLSQPGGILRFIKALFLTLAGMTLFFFLFKVIYPQSQRLTPTPQQITIINPADPAARALLHRVQDRDFAIVPDVGDGSLAVRLENLVPLFHPTFEKHEMQLQDLPHKPYSVPPPRLLDATAPVLPALDLSDLKPPRAMPAGSSGKPTLALTFSGDLATRKITRAPDFTALGLTDPEAWRFYIGVESNGRVSFAIPLAAGEQPKLGAQLAALFSDLRFKPVKGESPAIAWSTVTFYWNNPPP